MFLKAYQVSSVITLHSYFAGGATGVVDAVDQAVSDLLDTLRSAGLPGESALAAGRPGDHPRAAARLLPPAVVAAVLTSPANGVEGAPPLPPAMMRGVLVRVAAAAAAVQAGASLQSSGEAPPRNGRCCRYSARGLGLGEWPAVYLDLEMGEESDSTNSQFPRRN